MALDEIRADIADLIDLLYRAVASPEPLKLVFGDDRIAHLERKRLYHLRERERNKARPNRFSYPPRIPLDDLRMRVHRGNIYIGRANLLHGELPSPSRFEERPRPREEPVYSDDVASLPRWPPFAHTPKRAPQEDFR